MAVALADAILPVVDGLSLSATHRELLKPGARVHTRDRGLRQLPRYFYVVDSWTVALETAVTPHFGLWEFMDVDLREPAAVRAYPRYIPCAVNVLAAALEVFRVEVGAPVRIAANGGYRSPSHTGNIAPSAHSWGAAANIFRIGADWLDTQERIERYSAVVRRLLPFAWVRPYGSGVGMADDHLHLDLGYVTVVPHAASEQNDEASGDGGPR